MDNYEFIVETENIYRNNPSKFGFAFWKYRELLKTADVYKAVSNGYSHLYAIKDNKLIFYWSEDKSNMVIPMERLLSFDLLFVHCGYMNILENLKNSHSIYEGNALIYNKTFTNTIQGNKDYYVDSFNFNNDKDYILAADIINNSTPEGGGMTIEMIKGFTALPVYDKDLWIFVKEAKTHKPVSIGICIYDKAIKETELEWIFVHKDHQKRKVGRMLIDEIIRRCMDKSRLVRVGGVADDFYIKCGFNRKTEPWLWIPKKDTKVSWWDS